MSDKTAEETLNIIHEEIQKLASKYMFDIKSCNRVDIILMSPEHTTIVNHSNRYPTKTLTLVPF
jgi:hypothetical protein